MIVIDHIPTMNAQVGMERPNLGVIGRVKKPSSVNIPATIVSTVVNIIDKKLVPQ